MDPTSAEELPASADVVVGVSVEQLRAAAAFAPLWNAARVRLRPVLALVQKECHFDPLELVDSAVLASDGVEPGFSILLLRGRFREAQVDDCFVHVAAADVGRTVEVKKDGPITAYAAEGEPLAIHVAWLGPGYLLVPLTHLTERAWLERVVRAPKRLTDRPDVVARLRAASAGGVAAWAVVLGGDAGVPAWVFPQFAASALPVMPAEASASFVLAGGGDVRVRLAYGSEAAAGTAAGTLRTSGPMFLPAETRLDVRAAGADVEIAAHLDEAPLRQLLDSVRAYLGLAAE